jgi:surface polysaccharide O-acyltransferase-like enzyme
MNEQPENRVLYTDFLRIIAVFGVIVIHVGASGWYVQPEYTWNWQVMNMWHGIFRWPVPLFVMISGVFNIQNFKLEQPLKQGIKKIAGKIIRIYCALIFWTVFYTIINQIIASHSIKEFIKNPFLFLNFSEIVTSPYRAISGDSMYHLWFLYMIIGLYLLTPIVKVFAANAKKEYVEYFLILFFIIGAGVPFYNFINSLKDIPLLPHNIRISMPELSGYLAYYIAGYYFSNYGISKRMEYAIYILGVASMLFTVLGVSFISVKTGAVNATLLLPITPNIMFETYAVFLFFKRLFSKGKCPVLLGTIITHIGECSFGIYLIHVFMIMVVNYLGINWNTYNPIISAPIICVLVFLFSYVSVLGISKIPKISRYIL